MAQHWFKFYVDDWLGSSVLEMSPAEEGAYIHLLAIAWGRPDCSLPDDDLALSRLSRLYEGWFNDGSGERIRENFVSDENGRIYNPKLYDIWKEAHDWSEKSARGGRESGRVRRAKAKTKHRSKGGSSTVQRVVEAPQKPETREEKKRGAGAPPPSDGDADVPEKPPRSWRECPDKMFTAQHTIGMWKDACKHKKREHSTVTAKDRGQAKHLAQLVAKGEITSEAMTHCMIYHLEDADKWTLEHGHSIAMLSSMIQKYITRYEREMEDDDGMQDRAAVLGPG